jgi:hypothetical protein
VAVAATARSDGSFAGGSGGAVADAPATAPASAGTWGRLAFFFEFAFARTTRFAFRDELTGRSTLGREGVGATTFDSDCDGVLDEDGAARGWTALGAGFGFGFGRAAAGGRSGAGSGAGEGDEGSVTTGSVGAGSWARAAGANINTAVIGSASRFALLLRTGSEPLPSHSHAPCVGGVFKPPNPSLGRPQ